MLVRDGKLTMVEGGDREPPPSPRLLQCVGLKVHFKDRRSPQRWRKSRRAKGM